MILTLVNPETDGLEKSYLANPYSIGVTSIIVKNTDRFALNDRIMIGEMGEEKTEVVTVTLGPTDGMTLGIGPTVFSHEADTPVYRLRFDEAKFYRSTTGISGAYSVISVQPMDVDNANLTTIYDDTGGLASYYYKTTVYHSLTGLESDFTDPVAGTGYARNQVGYMIDAVLEEVNDQQEQHVSRNEILGWFNDVNDDLTIAVAKPYEFLKTRMVLDPIVNQNYLNYPTDILGNQLMWKFDHMDYNFIDSTTSPTTNKTYTLDMEDELYLRNKKTDNTIDATTVTDAIKKMALDNFVNRFRFEAPFATSNGTLYLHYYQFFPVLNSEGDLFITPTAKIYKLYAKSKYYLKRQIVEPTFQTVAQGFTNEYLVERASYSQHNRKDVGTPRAFAPRDKVVKSFRVR